MRKVLLFMLLFVLSINAQAEDFFNYKSYNEVLKDSLLVEEMVYGYIFKPSFDGEYGVSYVVKGNEPFLIFKKVNRNIFTMIDGQKYSSTVSVNSYTGAPMKIKKRIEVNQEDLVFDAKITTKVVPLDKATAESVVIAIKSALSQYKAPDPNPTSLILDGENYLFADKNTVVEYNGYNNNDSSKGAVELIAHLLNR